MTKHVLIYWNEGQNYSSLLIESEGDSVFEPDTGFEPADFGLGEDAEIIAIFACGDTPPEIFDADGDRIPSETRKWTEE
jgi:hypothetical protein